jgi:hypothetical protein
MLIDTQKLTPTITSGAGSGNTAPIRGLLKHIIVKPTTETTTYDVSIVNPLGAKIYERLSETGTLSELTDIPVNGIYTISIANSTVDEIITIQAITRE